MDRRAVRAVQANGVGAVGLGGRRRQRGAHLVVGHAETGRAAAPDGQARQPALGLVEGGAPGSGIDHGHRFDSAAMSRLSMP